MVEYLEYQKVVGRGELEGQEHFLEPLNVAILHSVNFGHQLLLVERGCEVGIDCAEAIHLRKLLGPYEAEVELLIVFDDGCGHHHIICLFRFTLRVNQCYLVVLWPTHTNADH